MSFGFQRKLQDKHQLAYTLGGPGGVFSSVACNIHLSEGHPHKDVDDEYCAIIPVCTQKTDTSCYFSVFRYSLSLSL